MQNWIYVLKGIRLKHLNIKIIKPTVLPWTLITMVCIISYIIFTWIYQYFKSFLIIMIMKKKYFLSIQNQIFNMSVYNY